MFGLGFWEIVIIAIVIIIALKPEDIPKFFRKMGKVYKEITDFNAEISKVIKDMDAVVKDPITSLEAELDFEKEPAEDPGKDLQKGVPSLTKTLGEKDN